tara:strand:+ start:7274 stop:8053 length:780 start_codon:yes stop_codon:yes gene_type:complete
MDIKVSIITPVYNSEETIKENILSIKKQNYKNIEHIIVDGNSSDKTLEIVNKYKIENTIIISEKDNGIYDAWNKGLKIASGDIIGAVMSDDFLNNENVISKIVEKFQINNCDILYANMDFLLEKEIVRKWRAGNFKKRNYYFGWMPPTPTVYFKKYIVRKEGYFNLKYKIASDYDFFLRIFFISNYKIFYLDEFIYTLRLGGESTKSIKNILKSNIECYDAWIENKLSLFPFWMILKPLLKIFQIKRFINFIKYYLKAL